VIEVVSVEDQVDAEREPDQLAVQRRLKIVDQRVLELPDVPDEGRFIERPLRHTRHVRRQVQNQRPGEQHRKQAVEAKRQQMAAPGGMKQGHGKIFQSRQKANPVSWQ
jgi:hypothetical protein